MLTGITADQVEKMISLLERISESRRARTADGSRVSVDEIADDPQRRELANYLYSLSGEARKELIALMLMGRGDVEHAYDRALETVRKYTAADDQVTYLMTKAFRLAEYLRVGLAAQADISGPPDTLDHSERGKITQDPN